MKRKTHHHAVGLFNKRVYAKRPVNTVGGSVTHIDPHTYAAMKVLEKLTPTPRAREKE